MWTVYDSVPGICRYISTDAQLRFEKRKLFSLRSSAAATKKKPNRIFCELLLPGEWMCNCVRNGGWEGEESTLGESEFVSLLLKFVVDDTPITSNVLFSVISFSKRHRQFQHPKMNKDAKYEENSTQKIAQSRCLKYDKIDIIIVCDAPVVGSLEPCLRIFVISIFPCFLFRWLCYGYHANDKRHWREKKARNTRREKNSDFFFLPLASFFRGSQPRWKQEWRNVT